jgi:hypothetical protein
VSTIQGRFDELDDEFEPVRHAISKRCFPTGDAEGAQRKTREAVMWDQTLEREFERVEQQPNAQVKGRMFEDVVRKLFERSRFQVQRNAGAGTPRQTDLFARRGDEEYLIEVKWRKTPADIADLDNLVARLRRAPNHVYGILISMAGFGTQLRANLEAHRERVILLLDDSEIRRIVAGEINLRTVLRNKVRSLTVDGKVLLEVGGPPWRDQPPPKRSDLTPADSYLWRPSDGSLPWITGYGKFGPLLFAHELPDIDWTFGEGAGISLDLRLPGMTRRDLAYVLDLIRRCIGVTSGARYSIQQSTLGWYGAGGGEFLNAVDKWEERYAAVDSALHESEEVSYFDQCEGGFFTLYAQIMARDSGQVRYASFSAQLAGIPIDVTPWRALAHALDLEEQAYFRPKGRASVSRIAPWAPAAIPLEVVAFQRLGTEDWINGIVTQNPFYRGNSSPNVAFPENDEVLSALHDVQLLVCSLSSYHEIGTLDPRRYYLRSLEAARSSDVTIIHPIADWEESRTTYHATADGEMVDPDVFWEIQLEEKST